LWSYKDTHTQRNCIRGICVCESRAVRLCACGREFNFLVHEKQRKSFKSYTQMCMAIVVSVGGDPLKPRILQIIQFHCLKFRQTTMGTHTLKVTEWVCLCALAFTFYLMRTCEREDHAAVSLRQAAPTLCDYLFLVSSDIFCDNVCLLGHQVSLFGRQSAGDSPDSN